jgi:hypothetical protein
MFMYLRRTAASGSRLGLCAAALLALAGCGEDRYKPMDRPNLGVPLTVQPVSPNDFQSTSSTGVQPVPEPVLTPEQNEDRIAKADIYFKFAWARSELSSRKVPYDLPIVVRDVKQRVGGLAPDRGATLIAEIVTLMEEGLEAHKLDTEVNALGLGESKIDWRKPHTPLSSIQMDKGDSSGAKMEAPGPSERRARQFAKLHRMPPSLVKWRKFQQACAKTLELADTLNVTEEERASSVTSLDAAARGGGR